MTLLESHYLFYYLSQSEKKRRAENNLQLTLLSFPVLQKSFPVTDADGFNHIFCSTQYRVWVSDWNTSILTDTATGDTQYSLKDILGSSTGKQTVNSDRELRRLEGQLSVVPNFTNSAIIFHIINDFNLNVKTIFKST